MQELVCTTQTLDYDCPQLESLVSEYGLKALGVAERVESVTRLVVDRIALTFCGVRVRSASKVWASGHGTVIERCAVAMALLRQTGVSCRLRAHIMEGAELSLLFGERMGSHLRAGVLVGVVEAFCGDRWTSMDGLTIETELVRHGLTGIGEAPEPDELDVPGGADSVELGVFPNPDMAVKRYQQTVPWHQRLVAELTHYRRMDRVFQALVANDICAN